MQEARGVSICRYRVDTASSNLTNLTLLHSDKGSEECMKANLRKALCPSVSKSPLVLTKGVFQKFDRILITPMFHVSCGQKSKPFGEGWN